MALGTVALLLVMAWAATSPLGPLLQDTPRPTTPPSPMVVPTASPEPAPTQTMFPEIEPNETATQVFGWVLMTVGALLGLLVLAVLVRWLLRVRWRAPGIGSGGDETRTEEGVEVSADEITADAAETLAASLARLRSGLAVGDAIVACWRRLEEVAAASGVPRGPADTAEEFTVDVLRHTPADPADLHRLADLYRAAMFSGRPLGDAARDRAVDCLESLLAAFAAGAPHDGARP